MKKFFFFFSFCSQPSGLEKFNRSSNVNFASETESFSVINSIIRKRDSITIISHNMLKASMNYMEVIELHSKLDFVATEVEKKGLDTYVNE